MLAAKLTVTTVTVVASWDPEAKVWFGSCDLLPLTTEAPSLDGLLARVREIAPEIAEMNGLVRSGDTLRIQLTTDAVAAVP
jgi:hypothetical protein